VNAAQGDGLTALHWAARRGHAEVADLEAKTRIGRYTPLHLASQGGHGSVVNRLLAAGGDPGAVTTNSGVTPLHLAAAAIGGAEAVAALLAHGADPNARESSAEQTPLMFASGSNRAEAARTLLQGGADPEISTKVVEVLPSLALSSRATPLGHLERAAAFDLPQIHAEILPELAHAHLLEAGHDVAHGGT